MTATEAAEIFSMTGDVKNPGDAVTVTNFSKEQCTHAPACSLARSVARAHTCAGTAIEVSGCKPLTVLSQQLKKMETSPNYACRTFLSALKPTNLTRMSTCSAEGTGTAGTELTTPGLEFPKIIRNINIF